MSKVYGVIPSRWGSVRFPGKPLELIGPEPKKPMFLRVYEQAQMCPELDEILLATDSIRIAKVAQEYDVPFVMTGKEHICGTDRIYEAAMKKEFERDSIIVNIQGDQPAFHPIMISELLSAFKDASVVASTLMRMVLREGYDDRDGAKIVVNKYDDIIYISRCNIPYDFNRELKWLLVHVGLFACKMNALEQFHEFGPSTLEKAESLEHLRLIEHGIPLRGVLTQHTALGVDRPEDIPIVEEILKKRMK